MPYGNANMQSAHILLTPQEYRAKLYSLNMDNKWIDIGTGHFRILLSKDNEEHYMQIISENVLLDEANLQSGEANNQAEDLHPKEEEKRDVIEYEDDEAQIKLHPNEPADTDQIHHQTDLEHHAPFAHEIEPSPELRGAEELAEFYEGQHDQN